jgi:hypothetical protein
MVVRNPWTKEEISRFGLEVEGPQRTPFDRLQHQAGKVVADNRSCALRPPTDGCPDDANAVLQSLFDGYRNGPLTASLANLASSDATCGQAVNVGLESMDYLRESELLGLNADASMWDSISAGNQAGGKLSVFGKGAQLCLKEAAKECELGHDIDGPVKQAHLAQRRKALTGGGDADESADTEGAEDRLRLLGCVERLINQCFAVGDALPLIDLLNFLEDSPPGVSKAMSDDDSSRLSSVLTRVRESLKQCARYRVTWKFEYRFKHELLENCFEFHEVDGDFAANLTYNSGQVSGQNSIRGESDPVRLTKANIYGGGRCSSTLLSPLHTAAPSIVSIESMEFKDAKPESVHITATEFGVESDRLRDCFEDICKIHETGNSPMWVFHVSGPNIITAVINDLQPATYPMLFQGKSHASKVTEGNSFDDNVSDIKIEHTGKRR